MEKSEAIVFLIKFLNSRMSAASLDTRQKALQAAKDHQITASELLEKYIELVQRI